MKENTSPNENGSIRPNFDRSDSLVIHDPVSDKINNSSSIENNVAENDKPQDIDNTSSTTIQHLLKSIKNETENISKYFVKQEGEFRIFLWLIDLVYIDNSSYFYVIILKINIAKLSRLFLSGNAFDEEGNKEENKSESSTIPLHILEKLETLERLIIVAASHTTNQHR